VIDTSRWRLPGFVDHATARDDGPSPYLAAKGIAVWNPAAPAPGQNIKIEVHLVGDRGWGIVTGSVEEARPSGEVIARGGQLTSDGHALLDRTWEFTLRYDASAFDGAWVAIGMTAPGVASVPRRWPRTLVEQLRAAGKLVIDDAAVPSLLKRIRDRTFDASTAAPDRCAIETANVVDEVLRETAELRTTPDDVARCLASIWH
jgi:hypothetical protein